MHLKTLVYAIEITHSVHAAYIRRHTLMVINQGIWDMIFVPVKSKSEIQIRVYRVTEIFQSAITQRSITKRFVFVAGYPKPNRQTNSFYFLFFEVDQSITRRLSIQVLPDGSQKPASISLSGPAHVFFCLYLLQHTTKLPDHVIFINFSSCRVCLWQLRRDIGVHISTPERGL